MTPEVLSDQLARVQQNIVAACERAGRDPSSVRLLPVTKGFSPAVLRMAHSLGLNSFGENRVQEAEWKAAELADLNVTWSIIGPLQRNKAKDVARFGSELQTLDSVRLATQLNRRLGQEGRTIRALIQVNTSREEQKSGVDPAEVPSLVAELQQFEHITLTGLMTMAMFDAPEADIRACFRELRELRDELVQTYPNMTELSMGMSGDYALAIEEGATIVRIGSAIFGTRE